MRLEVRDLSVHRGYEPLFKSVSFMLGAGDALILKGPNGAGKSSLLRALLGLLDTYGGQVTLSCPGRSDHVGAIGEFCHYLGHRNAMKADLSVRENLVFWQAILDGDNLQHRGGLEAANTTQAAAMVGLSATLHLPFGYLSAGQQRRMALAKLLLAKRPIWVLDEPTTALDAASEALFADLVADHRAAGGLVMAATHQPLLIPGADELRLEAPTESGDGSELETWGEAGGLPA